VDAECGISRARLPALAFPTDPSVQLNAEELAPEAPGAVRIVGRKLDQRQHADTPYAAGYAPAIWLVSVPTFVSFVGALVGAVLAHALTDLSRPLAILIGGAVGWLLFSLLFGGVAERLDRRLHRM
jgi:hypothetical protein